MTSTKFSPLIKWLVVVLAALTLPFLPPIQNLDLKVFDLEMRLLRHLAPQPAVVEVVIIGIDEHTYAQFPEPNALWHRHFGSLFQALAQAEPAAVALDVNLPDRSFEFLTPGNDRALLEGILTLRRAAPLVLGVTVDANGKPRKIMPAFVSVAGQGSTGFVQWVIDSDSMVRRFTEALADDGSSVPTLSGQITRRLGFEPDSGLIDWTIGANFSYVPMHDVLSWAEQGRKDLLSDTFAESVVVIGSVLPFVDRHYQPIDLASWEHGHFLPGVLLHAQALRSLLGPGLINSPPLPVLLLMITLASCLWWPAQSIARGAIVLVVFLITLPVAGLLFLQQGLFIHIVPIAAAGCLATISRFTIELVHDARQRKRLKLAFSGYVSPPVLNEILDGRLQPGIGGERRSVCILFSDIRGFTSISENMQPEEIISLLNRYFSLWAQAIQDLDGTLDKFIGDGIMAFFGAPKPCENPCERAFEAARNMLDLLKELNRTLVAEGQNELRIGIGLHYGDVVVGHMGADIRHEYTAIGDPVNLASRLEGLSKETGYTVMCSKSVVDALSPSESFAPLGSTSIRGHSPVEVFGWPFKENQSTSGDAL